MKVLGEGVDFPWLARIVDARPTLSPVSWLQLLGRETRPGARATESGRPEYICVCRNLERHAYLLQGLIPRRELKAAQEQFEKPSKRAQARSLPMEALGKFKPITLHLLDGVRGSMNLIYSVDKDTGLTTKWCALLDPTSERVISAKKVDQGSADGTPSWGRWEAAEIPDDLTGFRTSQLRGKPSDKQREWWERAASRYGLDPGANPSAREFEALPVLSNLCTDLHGRVQEES